MPNTEVKHSYVESTCLETGWEDRALPVKMKRPFYGRFFRVLCYLVERTSVMIYFAICRICNQQCKIYIHEKYNAV